MNKCHFDCFVVAFARSRISSEWWSLGKNGHFEQDDQLGIFHAISFWMILSGILHCIWNDADIILRIVFAIEFGPSKLGCFKGVRPD
jgi:hypothetical protein